jgi:hypothetical protein
VVEGADTLFKNMTEFIVGGKVDSYFHSAFYALWNAGMQQDFLQLRAANPDYELWVN